MGKVTASKAKKDNFGVVAIGKKKVAVMQTLFGLIKFKI